MSATQHHEIAVALRARQRLLEQVDQLLRRLVESTPPELSAAELERVSRIRTELADLHHATACASGLNREALHSLRAPVSHPHGVSDSGT